MSERVREALVMRGTPGTVEDYDALVAERDALREELERADTNLNFGKLYEEACVENERLREVAQAWLELHSFPHTPLDVFNLADRTRAALDQRKAKT